MYAGGSGEFSITHVKFMVDPLSMYRSGAPIISVDGSAVVCECVYVCDECLRTSMSIERFDTMTSQ